MFTKSSHGACPDPAISAPVMSVSSRAVGLFFIATLFASASSVLAVADASGPAPDWTEWYRRGEAARASGKLVEASAAFARARAAAAPGNPLPTRAACEVARFREEQGDRSISSREPCNRAMVQGGLAEDFANEVASLLAPSARPSFDDLALVALTAEAAQRVAPDQPWGAFAECAIGRRLGSADIMSACQDKLRRFSPTHPAAQQALAFARIHTSPLVWALRALVLLGMLATLVHVLTNRRRRSARRSGGGEAGSVRAALLMLSVVVGAQVHPAIARAEPSAGKQDLSDFIINDENPESSVPSVDAQNKHPLEFGYFLQDLAARYDKAVKAEDHQAAVRYLRALTKATPTAFAPRKLCEELEKLGDLATATKACRTAITRAGATAGDFIRFVGVTLSQPGPLPMIEKEELNTQLEHLASQVKADGEVSKLRCDVAIRFHDVAALEACSSQLVKIAPNDPKTVSYLWVLALERHDSGAAFGLVRRARELGMSADGVARMESATREMRRQRIGRLALLGLALVMFVLAGRSGWRWVSSRRRVSETASRPSPSAGS